MRPDNLRRFPQLEELERREAPATLTVTPHAPAVAAPVTATIASQGCDHGITAHAAAASGGVVKC
jgi:hypothetical protein